MRAFAVVSASVGIVGIVLLGGCTSEGAGSAGGDAGGAIRAGAQAVPAPAHDPASGATQTALLDSGALIRTADLRVAVRSVGSSADRADDIAVAAGGQVYGDDRSTGTSPSAALTLKVPPQRLSDVLGRLAALGTEKARDVSTQDVTQQVADVTSRVQSAQDSIARLRTLYGDATKVSDVIAIESELATRESDLESLEAQQRTLSAQTSMATVHLDLVVAAPPSKHAPSHAHGIGGALVTGWHGFTAAAAWVARALATALPFLALILLVAGSGLLIWRRRPPSTPAPRPDAG